MDADGFIRREGSPDRVGHRFAPVVERLRERAVAAYPRMNGLYLYGSVPRGTARPGRSDLDALVVLDREPTDDDHAVADEVITELDAAYPQIDGGGILVFSRERLLSAAERHDLGFMVACLCTPLRGEDLADLLPRYRPSERLARDTNGDIGSALERLRRDPGDRTRLCRTFARKLVRTGFTLVMPRWGGWTSDLALSHRVVASYYSDWDAPLRRAVRLATDPDPDALDALLDFGDTVAAEYAARIGLKQG